MQNQPRAVFEHSSCKQYLKVSKRYHKLLESLFTYFQNCLTTRVIKIIDMWMNQEESFPITLFSVRLDGLPQGTVKPQNGLISLTRNCLRIDDNKRDGFFTLRSALKSSFSILNERRLSYMTSQRRS
ncbi:hypothetical protein BY458DRAFT_486975 [Sporodiniella umbellata]|nr:hypothetical protein BY458DRAFT_486975 [Sporodiniella umbellata]